MKPTDVFEKSPRITWRQVEDEMVLIDPDEAELLRLTPVGAAIWETLDGRKTAEEIAASLQETFEASPMKIRQDVLSFLEQLRRYGLVEPTGATATHRGTRSSGM